MSESEELHSQGESEPYGRGDSVTQCLEIMKEVSAEQRARSRHLDTKTGTIAGFCATVLTLNVTLGRPLLDAYVTPGQHSAIRILFLAGSMALASGAFVAVAGVLSPMGHDDLTEEAIDGYSARPKVITPPEELRMTWLQTVTLMAKSDRKASAAKASRSKIAVVLLAVGLGCVAGEAVTLYLAS